MIRIIILVLLMVSCAEGGGYVLPCTHGDMEISAKYQHPGEQDQRRFEWCVCGSVKSTQNLEAWCDWCFRHSMGTSNDD